MAAKKRTESADAPAEALWERLQTEREILAWAETLQAAPPAHLAVIGQRLARADDLDWLLTLSRADSATLVLTAIEGLGHSVAVAAARRLNELAEAATLPKDLRRAARRSLHRIRSRGVAAPAAPRPAVPSPSRPATGGYQATDGFLSAVDYRGHQAFRVLIERPARDVLLMGGIVDLVEGLIRCEVSETTKRQAREANAELGQETDELASVVAPGDYVLWRVREAVAASRAAGHGLPSDYLLFATEFDRVPVSRERALVYDALEESERRPAIPTRDRLEDLLAAFPIDQWSLGDRELTELAEEIRQIQQSRIVLSPNAQQERFEQLRRRAWDVALTETAVRRLGRALQETAYYFLRRGKRDIAVTAAQTALALDPASGIPVRRNPLALAMVDRALGLAPQDLPAPDIDPTTGYRRVGGAILLE